VLPSSPAGALCFAACMVNTAKWSDTLTVMH
jgi:hypothetical protein